MATNDIKTYTGEQVVLSSGRLVFNSRSNDTYLNAKRYINLSAGDKVTIDVGPTDSDNEENMFLVNAPKMQFGLDRYGVVEPITKADELEKVLIELIEAISTYSDMVQAAAITPGPIMSIMLTPATSFLKGRLEQVKFNMINFKSTKSFTI
jgi:hypothetical protein